AADPSFKPEELPAVTGPPFLKNGGSLASCSSVGLGRGCSSCSTHVTWPFRPGTGTGTSSCGDAPPAIARAAHCWLWSANSSCASRDTEYLSATRSAVSPSVTV